MQIIAGLVEHRLSDMFADQTLFVNMISFVARTINSYWGTQVETHFLFNPFDQFTRKWSTYFNFVCNVYYLFCSNG